MSKEPDAPLFRLCPGPRGAAPATCGWGRAWARPSRSASYEVVIVGAGGHGLATAYYLAKNHGITDVAVLEKGWLGGGNTGRNTTIIRSNYLQPPSVGDLREGALRSTRTFQELNFNVMFCPRGVLMLAQTEHELRAWKRTAHANRLAGIESELVDRERIRGSCRSSTSTARATRCWAPSGSRAAAPPATTPSPGAMPGPPAPSASTSSRTARSPASTATRAA